MEWITAPAVDGDPFGMAGTHEVTGTPEAVEALARKQHLLNSVMSWIVFNHADEVPDIVTRWCENQDFAATAFANALRQRDLLVETLREGQ